MNLQRRIFGSAGRHRALLAAAVPVLLIVAACSSPAIAPASSGTPVASRSASGLAPSNSAVAAQPSTDSIPGLSAIVAGSLHTCVLTTAGGVKCWGYNKSGALGNGTGISSNTPVDVIGLTSKVIAIAAGGYDTCAITSQHGLKCWGDNTYGQLGTGSKSGSLAPVDVSGLTSGVVSVAMSLFNACAVTDKGAVKCWGRNTYGALGNGSTVDSLVPVDVSGLKSGVTAVAVDSYESCALTKGGAVWCWGFLLDANHPLAMPTHTTPVYIYGLTSGVTAFAIGSAICGIFAGGALKCSGINEYGQVGDGTTKQRTTLVGVVGLSSGVRALATGGNFYCALTSGGTVKCWGNNVSGQLGDGSTTQRDAPVVVAGLKGKVAAIAAGDGHACAVLTAGGVECWGAYGGSGVGMLGVDSSTGSLTPVDVAF